MAIIKHVSPLFYRSLMVIFNVHALRKAFQRRLLSWEFFVGFVCWALSAGVILSQWWVKQSLPGWFMGVIVPFSLFTGGSWVLAPILMYLERTSDRWMCQRMPERFWFQWITGERLWHQAALGKLSPQFLAEILAGLLLWLTAFRWTMNQPWQAWMVVIFFVHTLFFVICPLLCLARCVTLTGHSHPSTRLSSLCSLGTSVN